MPHENKKKVLIVDDESHVVSYLEALLQDHGYATVSAVDGIDGLEKARQEKPDVVALDVSMPKKSGIRMFRDMRENEELKSVPVVIVTAVTGYGGDPEGIHKFLDEQKQVSPPEGFVAKPIDQALFLKTIAEVLQKHATA